MATTWIGNLIKSVTGGAGAWQPRPPAFQPKPAWQPKPSRAQTGSDRLSSLSRYYQTKSQGVAAVRRFDTYNRFAAQGVAAVRGADRYVREGPAARQVRLNATEAARYNAAADYYRKQLGLYKGYQADANRYTGQAAAYLAEQERLARAQQAYADRYKAMQDAYYAGLNQPSPGNQYGYGYGYDYPSYDTGGGATLPDWYNSFLNQFAWRI